MSFIAEPTDQSLDTHRSQLSIWLRVRSAFITLLTLFSLSLWLFDFSREAGLIAALTALLALVNWLSYQRLRQQLSVTTLELCLHFSVDIFFLSLAMGVSGALNNPFTSLLLIPLCVAAATCPRRLSIAVGAWALMCFSLLFVGQDLYPHTSLFSSHDAHLAGMWGSFALCALLLLGFINSLSQQLRRQTQARQQLQADHEAKSRVLSMAIHTANVAHNLATPLNNAQLLCNEIQLHSLQSPIENDLLALQQQLAKCQNYLRQLHSDNDEGVIQSNCDATTLIERVRQDFQLLYPSLRIHLHLSAPSIFVSCVLEDALHNILENSRQAGADEVNIAVHLDNQQVTIRISDNGHGLSLVQQHAFGKAPMSSQSGMGMGIYLTQLRLASIGGRLGYQTPSNTENKIDANSKMRGATLLLSLPCVTE